MSTPQTSTHGAANRLHVAAVSPWTVGYPGAILGDKPVAYYPMQDNSIYMSDAGPNHIGGLYGSAVTRGVAPLTADMYSSASFPGGAVYNPNGYAYTPKTPMLQLPHPTMEIWFSLNAPNNTSHDLPLLVYGSVARAARYGLFIHGLGSGQQSLEIQLRAAAKPALITLSKSRFAVGQTYHIVVCFDGNTVSTYVNGVLDASTPYSGEIDYSTLFSDGLQVGGADQAPTWGSASFPGTLAQAAVYSAPLTPTQIANHYLAGQLIPMTTETPAASDSFVDSVGVNTHFENPDSIYGQQFPAVANLLVNSGIRHIRAGITYTLNVYPQQMKQLAAAGVYASYETSNNMTQAQIQQWPNIVGSSFEQYEAPNEQDDVANPNWMPGLISFQKNLYSWVKSDPQIARFPVVGPSLVSTTDDVAVGDLSAYMDNGNVHNYFGVFNPGTYGWGGTYPPFGVYGSIDYNLNAERFVSGTKPIEATETGYGTIAGNPLTLDYRTHLRYMTRLFFEQFNHGIVRSYTYELMDEGGSTVFNNFGLVTTNLQPKPAYTGIKSLLAQLADPGAAFTPTPLPFKITGFINAVHHTLLQKRNGHYILAIWIEVPSWVTLNNAGGDIIIPSQTVTLTTGKQFSSATLITMDESGNMAPAPLSWSGNSATLSVTDKVSLIDLAP